MKNSGRYLTNEEIQKTVAAFMYIKNDNRNTIGLVAVKNDLFYYSLYNEKEEMKPDNDGIPFDVGFGILEALINRPGQTYNNLLRILSKKILQIRKHRGPYDKLVLVLHTLIELNSYYTNRERFT